MLGTNSLPRQDSGPATLGSLVLPDVLKDAKFSNIIRACNTALEASDLSKEQATRNLKAARTRYLEQKILLREVQDVLNSAPQDGLQTARQHEQVLHAAQRLGLPTAGADNLQQDAEASGSARHVLGVTPNDLLAQLKDQGTAKHEHAAALAPAVEARLAQRVSCLSAAWTGVGGSSSSGPDAAGPTDSWRSLANLGPAPSSKLPQMWSQGQSQQGGQRGSSRPGMEGSDDAGLGPGSLAVLVAERQAALQAKRAAVMAALSRHLGAARELLGTLGGATQNLLTFTRDRLLGTQQQLDQFNVDLACEHSRSLSHKLMLVEMQINAAVYTRESIGPLARVEAALSARAQELGQALARVQRAVAAYEELGPAFKEIVERYTRASAELASAQAALSTFTELECELMGREGA